MNEWVWPDQAPERQLPAGRQGRLRLVQQVAALAVEAVLEHREKGFTVRLVKQAFLDRIFRR